MRTVTKRTLAASALAAPLALGLSGIASADNYPAHTTNAGAQGVSSATVHANSGARSGQAAFHVQRFDLATHGHAHHEVNRLTNVLGLR